MIEKTLNSRFYYPLKLHTGNVVTEVDAPLVESLGDPYRAAVRILSLQKGSAPQGLYVCNKGRWGYALPMQEVSAGVVIGYVLQCYIDLDAPVEVPEGTKVFRNGQQIDTTTLLPGVDVWTTLNLLPAGTVNSVNGVLPDSSGNIQLASLYEMAVSIPFSPTPSEPVFYQHLPAGTYLFGSGVCEEVVEPIVFPVFLDDLPVGNITYANNVGAANLSIVEVTANQILQVNAPDAVPEGATKFAFTLTFKRT